jgi:hypothetical protein
MICDECETVAHCSKHGCIPKHQALDKMAENARELGLDYEQYKDAIEVSVIFHEGQKMFAVPKQPAQQEPVACVGPWHGGRLTLIPRYSRQTFEHNQPLYTAPPVQRKPLTDKEIADIATSHPLTWVNLNTVEHRRYFARAIEAAHGIKENT